LAYVIDPSLEVSLKFSSGTEGSLSLNTVIKTVREKATDKVVLGTIIMTVLGWFGTDIRQYMVAQLLDTEFKSAQTLSAQELQQINDTVSKALQGKVAEHEVQQIYRELSVDPAVRGVGATRHPGKKPDKIVPRSEFPRHAPHQDDTISEKRVREEIEDVTLISPVLLPGERRWAFFFS
jgi:hypothetical protein